MALIAFIWPWGPFMAPYMALGALWLEPLYGLGGLMVPYGALWSLMEPYGALCVEAVLHTNIGTTI